MVYVIFLTERKKKKKKKMAAEFTFVLLHFFVSSRPKGLEFLYRPTIFVQVLQWHILQIEIDRTESTEDDSCVVYVQSV